MLRRLLHRALGRRARRPPSDLQPTVEWQVCGACNYDCSYCIQSRRHRRGVPGDSKVNAIIEGFARLPGRWEIKLSGGEPFAYRGLIDVALRGLVQRTRHDVSLLTNLSASEPDLLRLCVLTGERLRVVSASLHLERVALDDFAAKAARLKGLLLTHNPRASLVVNSVVVPGRVAEHREIRRRLAAGGLRYFPQLMKTKGGLYPYSEADQRLIEELLGESADPGEANRAPSYRGRWCEAGVWYFVVDQEGRAFTCRSGRRLEPEEDEGAGMGSLVGGSFRLRGEGGACPYPYCPCTVPANRGIVRLPEGTRAGGLHAAR